MNVVPLGSDRRVALLVDGDNLSPTLAGPILRRAERLGRVDIRRVYAAEAGFRAWEDMPGFRPIRVGGAKNGTDILLCIDAVEMACGGRFEAFVLASDDRDFGHLAHWLRERGMFVLGLGTGKAVAAWRAACSEFVVLEVVSPAPVPVVPAVPKPEATPKPEVAKPVALSKTDLQIRSVILDEGTGGAIEMGRLGGRMGAVHMMTLDRLGATSWRAYLEARPHLYALDPKGAAACVRWIGPKAA